MFDSFRHLSPRASERGANGPIQDLEIFRKAERANARTTAYSRLGIALLVAALLLSIAPRGMQYVSFAKNVALAYLALAALGVVLVRRRRFSASVPYLLASLDVVFFLSVTAFYDRFPGTLPTQFRPAVISVWGFFIALALSTIRGRPGLLVAQTLLFAGGFMLAVGSPPSLKVDDPELSHALAAIFGPGYNAVRALVILITGVLLIIAAVRARANLRDAIAASRRAGSLARYFAPTVAKIVADTEIAALREGRQQDMAVLFADVRGFTSLSETLAPREIAVFLNEFRSRVTHAIEREGGVIDKFVGDEVMGLFGLPAMTPQDAANAVRAGHHLLTSINSWNVERARSGLSPVQVGVGLHYGPVFVGALGTDRLEFTVLGDTVNVARRLEELTKSLGHDFVASARVFEATKIDGIADRSWLILPPQTVRGHRELIDVFAPLHVPSARPSKRNS